MRPWNVLGAALPHGKETKAGPEPDGDTLLQACVGLEDLRKPGRPLGQLPGTLGAIMRYVGNGEDTNFPDDVLAEINSEGQAGYHRYGYPTSKHVVHVVPNSLGQKASSQPLQRRLGLSVRSMHRMKPSGALLCLSVGSVIDFEGSAVVNAANEGCIQGAGVDDAINVAGGKALQTARKALPVLDGVKRRDGTPTEVRCPMGEVRVTIGGDLKASWCIHAVGPNYNVEAKKGVSMDECDALVKTVYSKVIEAAKEKNLESVGFALISAGMFRGKQSLTRVLELGVSGIRDAAYPGLKEVHLVGFTDEEQEALRRACDVVLPGCKEALDVPGEAKMSEAAAIDKIAGAYSSVFSVATQVDKKSLRLSPISDGSDAPHLRNELPRITAAALLKAARQLPAMILEKLPAAVELCVEDPSEAPKYEAAFKEQCTCAAP